MIFGRPTNLWLGLTTALSGAIAATAIILGADPTAVGTLAGVWTGVLGAAVLVIANQPPVLNPGDAYTVVTTGGDPNVSKVANTNMAAKPPAQG
jgi:hypothetical protein